MKTKTEEIAWVVCEDCCKTPNGKKPPTLDVDVDVLDGGSGLSVKVDASHACGLEAYAIQIILTGTDGKVWRWSKGDEDTSNMHWSWRPNGPHSLPTTPLAEVVVFVGVTSKCGTGANDRVTIKLV